MNTKVDIIGPEAMPKVLYEQGYNEYLDAFKKLDHEKLFTTAYRKIENSNSYELDIQKLDVNSKKQLWDHYAAINQAKWSNDASVFIVAQYIYDHRKNCGRIGDQDDDYRKAEYLVNLVKYLNQRHSSVIQLRQDDEMEEIIDEVNNIFDSAYFRKLNHPELTDTECFFEAEREYCEDKEIDFLAYQLRDYDAAERIHAKQEIDALAYQNFVWRKTTGEPGDEKSDWAAAEERYPKWRMTKRIATICWNLSSDKGQHRDVYWSQACAVIVNLDARGINYVGVNPYEPRIHDVILEFIK